MLLKFICIWHIFLMSKHTFFFYPSSCLITHLTFLGECHLLPQETKFVHIHSNYDKQQMYQIWLFSNLFNLQNTEQGCLFI